MRLIERLKSIIVALGVLLGLAPVAVLVTFLAMPIWRWLEQRFVIEAVGHSGPAQWVFLLVYFILIALTTSAWQRLRRKKRK